MAGVLAIAFVALLWAGFLALILVALFANWRDKRKRKKRGMPESPEVADTLGLALYRKGLYESAIGMFQEAIKLSAKNKQAANPTYYYQLGLAYENAEKPALARQNFERVLKIDPHFSVGADIRKQFAHPQS